MAYTQQSLLCSISEAQFICVELQLYLDTHPDDQKALTDYAWFSKKLKNLIAQYESQYGPLLNFGLSDTAGSSWVNSKWPWE